MLVAREEFPQGILLNQMCQEMLSKEKYLNSS